MGGPVIEAITSLLATRVKPMSWPKRLANNHEAATLAGRHRSVELVWVRQPMSRHNNHNSSEHSLGNARRPARTLSDPDSSQKASIMWLAQTVQQVVAQAVLQQVCKPNLKVSLHLSLKALAGYTRLLGSQRSALLGVCTPAALSVGMQLPQDCTRSTKVRRRSTMSLDHLEPAGGLLAL